MHGIVALPAIKIDDKPLIAGKKVTGFSNKEEYLNRTAKAVPFFTQDALIDAGADYSQRLPFTAHAVRDGRLITGQNS